MTDIGERLAVLENEMEAVKEGVSNFRKFQYENREFMIRFDESRKASENRAKRIERWALVLIPILPVLIGYVMHLVNILDGLKR